VFCDRKTKLQKLPWKSSSNAICRVMNLLSRALTSQIDWLDIHRENKVSLTLKGSSDLTLTSKILEICDLGLVCHAQGEKRLIVSGPPLGKEWFASALQVSVGLIEILGDHDEEFFNHHDAKAICSVLPSLVNVEDYLTYIDILKYSTTWMHARSLRQATLPERPASYKKSSGPPLLFAGSVRKFLQRRLIAGNKPKNQHLFWSIAQVKRCAAVVPEEFIQKSLEKHRVAMDKQALPSSDSFIDQFISKMNVILKNIEFGDVEKNKEFSTNACYENSRTKGGAKAYIMNKDVIDGYTNNDELISMDFCPYKGVTERRGYVCISNSERLRSVENKQCDAKVYSICEPLKIRNITCGNALPYALAGGMQKAMHSSLKKMPQFKLIGESLTTDHIQSLLDKRSKDQWVASGDFSAATDNVKIELTKICFEAILNKLVQTRDCNPYLVEICRRVLYEHKIWYPENPKAPWNDVEEVVQKNGQLMGSVLSFPILCIINLITYWIAVEPEKKLSDLNVLVNGDDIMFCCTQLQYDNWLSILPEAGLVPSPGKNFFHNKYCTVNSALFYMNEKKKVIRIPFFNVGMLMGQSKVTSTSDGRAKPIHCLYDNVIDGALNVTRADSRFKYYNLESLKRSSIMYDGTHLNWYLPRTMGGLGMRLPPRSFFVSEHEKTSVGAILLTDRQRVIAHGLRDAWYAENLQKPPFKPIGLEEDPDIQNWGNDINKRIIYKARLAHCPSLPDMRPTVDIPHPTNWYLPFTGFVEKEALKYIFRGLSFRRFGKPLEEVKPGKNVLIDQKNGKAYKMLSIDNPHLYEEIILEELCYDRTGYTRMYIPDSDVFNVTPVEDYYL
jgi:hypothetical protein